MALIDPAPIDIRIKELHGKKILITMCLFWLEARFAFCDCIYLTVTKFRLFMILLLIICDFMQKSEYMRVNHSLPCKGKPFVNFAARDSRKIEGK